MNRSVTELIHSAALIIGGILLLLFISGVPGLGPIVLIIALILILMGVIKTNYHHKLLAQLKR